VVAQLILRPVFPDVHDWADFFYYLAFFVCGYILYADGRFARAIRRDWLLVLILGIIFSIPFLAVGAADKLTWMTTPGIPAFYLLWSVVSVSGWCWSIFMLYAGMRYLDFRDKWLEYGQEMILPFFVFHQPVIIVIAFYVVRWDAGILVKLPVVVLSSFVILLSLYELFIRRVSPLRGLFGMKPSFLGKG
jgi:glucan biosynthesis protein C